MIISIFIKVIGLILFIVGDVIILYPLIKLYKAAKNTPDELVENVLKDINFTNKKIVIGCMIAIVGGIMQIFSIF